MATLNVLSIVFYLVAATFSSITYEVMKNTFKVRYFFNFFGSILAFLFALLFSFWLFSDYLHTAAAATSIEAASVSISSCVFYFLLMVGWYLLSFFLKQKHQWKK